VPLRGAAGFTDRCADGYLHTTLPVMGVRNTADQLNNTGIAHGGFLATMADTAYGLVMRRDEPDCQPRTAQLSVSFLAPVRAGDWVEAHVVLHKRGRRLTNATCHLMVGERMVLQTTGVFVTA
jgi:uncharacterized protein (TIGR00369 family)